jgi:hypothetical protein
VSASFQLPIPLRATFDHLKNNMLRPEVCWWKYSDLPLQSHTWHGNSLLSAASHVLMSCVLYTVGCVGQRWCREGGSPCLQQCRSWWCCLHSAC